jgi:hypothetical protein
VTRFVTHGRCRILFIIGLLWLASLIVGVAFASAAAPGAVPGLVSTTHADPALWYPSANPSFTWNAASAGSYPITGYSFVLDQSANTVPGTSSAANSFLPQVSYTVGSGPAEDRVADLNGDGKKDIVAENSGSNTVSLLVGNGDGTFKAAVNYGTGTNPWSLEIGDVNGDGKLDMVTCNEAANTVSVLLGNGDGTFQAAVSYTTGANTTPECMRLGDLNGDSKLDIVTANAGNNDLSVLLNNGNGTFGSPATFDTDTHPTSIAIADLNGDGKQDLVSANYATNNVSVLLGKGAGTFQAAVNNACGAAPETVIAADLNGDGKPDVATVNYTPSTASVLLNNGNGTLATHVDYTTGSGPYSLDAADLNHDGVPDLVTTNHSANSVSILYGNGNGTFTAKTDLTTGTGAFWVALGDFTSDGYGDLAVTNETAGTVSVLLGSGYFRPAGSTLAATFTGKADGIWYFHVRAVDSHSEGGTTSTCTVRIDTTAPSTTATGLMADANTGWTKTTPQSVTLTATDAASGMSGGSAAIYYRIDSSGAYSTYSSALSISTPGSHKVDYYSVDAAGNAETAKTGYVNIDTTAPTTTASGLAGSATSGWTKTTPQTVTLTATDGGSGMSGGSAAIYYRIDSAGDYGVYSGPFTIAAPGSHEVDYYSVDALGNAETSLAGYVNIDTTPPTTTQSGADGDWHASDVPISFTADDHGLSGVARTEYRIDPSSDADPWTAGAAMTVRASLGDGVHTVQYRSVDDADNVEAYNSCTVKIDTQQPVTIDNATSTWHPVPFTLELTASGISGTTTQYSIGDDLHWQSGNAVPFTSVWKRGGGSGTVTVYYRSTNGAGLVEAEKSCVVLIDTSRPSATDDAPSGPQSGDVTVHLTGHDTFSGVAETFYQLDGATWTSGTSVYVPALPAHANDGLHTIRYYAIDYAGNVETGYRVCTVRITTP